MSLTRVNLPLSTVEVRFEKLTIAAPISVGSSGLPTITNAYRGMFDVSVPDSPNIKDQKAHERKLAHTSMPSLKQRAQAAVAPASIMLPRMLHIFSPEFDIPMRKNGM